MLFTREIVNENLNKYITPSQYIKYYTFFYSEDYKKEIRDKKYYKIFEDAVYDPIIRLFNSLEIMNKEISYLISTGSGNTISLLINELKQDLKENQAKYNREKILKEIEEYNQQEIKDNTNELEDYELSKITNRGYFVQTNDGFKPYENTKPQLFLIDTTNIDNYFDAINDGFREYEEVIMKYISLYDNGNLNFLKNTGKLVQERIDLHKEKLNSERNKLLPKKNIYYSLRLKNYSKIKNSKALEFMKDSLKNGHFIDDSTTLPQFKKMFSGEQVTKKVIWIGTAPELCCFIKRIYDAIDNKVSVWETVHECFENSFTETSLRRYKDSQVNSERLELLKACCSNLLKEDDNLKIKD